MSRRKQNVMEVVVGNTVVLRLCVAIMYKLRITDVLVSFLQTRPCRRPRMGAVADHDISR